MVSSNILTMKSHSEQSFCCSRCGILSACIRSRFFPEIINTRFHLGVFRVHKDGDETDKEADRRTDGRTETVGCTRFSLFSLSLSLSLSDIYNSAFRCGHTVDVVSPQTMVCVVQQSAELSRRNRMHPSQRIRRRVGTGARRCLPPANRQTGPLSTDEEILPLCCTNTRLTYEISPWDS